MVETSGTSKNSASAMAGWATSQSCACTTSGRQAWPSAAVLSASPARVIEWPIASVHAIMSVPKSNSCGSCAAATTRTPSLTSSVDGCVLGSVSGGPAAEHHDLVPGGGQRRGQLVDVPAEPADHHRRVLPRHHQDLHRHARGKPVARRRRRRTGRRRGSSRLASRCGVLAAARRAARRRSRGWRARAGGRGSGRSRPPSPC